MFIDTHCHPYLAKDKKLADILSNFERSDGKYLVSIWTDINTSLQSVALAINYDYIYSTVWIHPTDVLKSTHTLEQDMQILEKYIKNNPEDIVWIWETWLDYYWVSEDPLELSKQKRLQEEYFIAHINLAKKHNLPVIIHNRNSWEDILRILKENNCTNFIIHCFSENLEFAQKCFEISPDAMMSFSWIVTFKNASDIAQTAANIPLKNILIETDAPFLTPVPYRWKQENEPSYTQYILEKLIELRTEPAKQVEEIILENSHRVFKLRK
jgi:TatD DNase family protein